MSILFNIIFVLIRIMLGAAVFSFINVVAYRSVRGEKFVAGRSKCDFCQKPLKPLELIPIISFLIQKGKCCNCGAKLSKRYLFTEGLGGLFLCASALCFSEVSYGVLMPSLAEFTAFAVLALLVAITLVDLEIMEIPNGFVLALAFLAIPAYFFIGGATLLERGIGFLSVSLPMYLIAVIIKGGFGGGDIKLMAAAGLLLGWKLNLLAVFIGFVTGGAVAAIMLKKGNKKTGQHIPFGPYLSLGIAVALFFGNSIINWYSGLFA